MSIKIENVKDIQIDGVDSKDYPDFSDAFIASAICKSCGKQLTEEQLEELQESYPEVVSQLAYESLITN